jgi:Zn-dependent protease with chaperone function
MNSYLRTAALVAALLLIAGPVAAEPPPPQAQLDALLRAEPITVENWSRWSPRLQEWSGEHFNAAGPAFIKAFEFVKLWQAKSPNDRRKAPWKTVEDDAVAWMVLAGSILHDAKPSKGPVAVAKDAEKPAQESIRRNKNLAHSHYYLSWALAQQQTTPPEKGGPARPDVNRLRDALKELKIAQELAPTAPWMTNADAGGLAMKAKKWDDAETYLQQALQESPENVELARPLAQAIVEQGQERAQHSTSAVNMDTLVKRFPNDGIIAAFNARSLSLLHKEDAAAAEIDRARQLGAEPEKLIDPGLVRHLDDTAKNRKRESDQRAQEEKRRADQRAADERRHQLEEERRNAPTPLGRLAWWVVVFSLFYGCVMGLMCLVGWLLARRTRGPRAAEILASDSGELTSGGKVVRTKNETALARFYLIALVSALVLFYVSLPFVFIGLLIVLLCLVVFAFSVNRRSQAADVHSALMKASTGGIGAIFQATFARTGSGCAGLEKDAQDCPKLWQAIEEVARRVDTEPPDEVYISPGADFFVYQEGRGPFGVFGSRKRVLSLGMCVMNFLTISELKSILAHEFAHYSHADTKWSRFLFQVTLSLRTAMREMARTGGWVTMVNPFYWFFWCYSKSYNILSSGFSRSREYLADRMACTLYGSDVFISGLRKVIIDGSYFEANVYTKIARLLGQKKQYVNMYVPFRKEGDASMTEDERRKRTKKLLGQEASMFDSHPTYQERMEAAKPLPPAVKKEDAPSLQLFEQPDKVEQELTDYLTQAMARYLKI